MGDAQGTLRWDGIRETVREPIVRLIESLQARLGDHLDSVSVVGSALTDDFQPGTSDINTVIVLDEHTLGALNSVVGLGKTLRRHRLSPPLLMTSSYIRRSCDVFGMEFLDFQLTHATVLGADPFAAMTFDKPNVRLQCERELKATLVRLRQGWIAAAGDKKLVRDILISTAKGLAPLLRAMLWLKDIERPKTMEAALREAAGRFGVELDAVIAAERWRYEKPRLSEADVENAFVAVVGAVDRLATIIDEIEL